MKILILSAVLLMTFVAADADWILETLDAQGTTGYWPAIRVDSQGLLQIVYRDESDNSLVYTWQDGGDWVSETIDTCDCLLISMVLDSQDKPRISYWNQTEEFICAVRWSGSSWITDSIASAEPYAYSWPQSDIEVDSLDRSHLVWYNGADSSLHYAVQEISGEWIQSIVDSSGNTGIYPSLRLDTGGSPGVSYCNRPEGNLLYAKLDERGWQVQVVDSLCSYARYTSLELDNSGAPHILYHRYIDICDSAVSSISYASLNGAIWEVEQVYTGSYLYPSSPQGLVLDAEDNPHACTYYTDSGGYLSYRYRDSAGWHSESVDGPGAALDRSICLDASGNPNIAYCLFNEGDLRWAHRTATGTWSSRETVPEVLNEVSLTPSMNPTFGSVSVILELPSSARVSISLYDISGRIAGVLPPTELLSGTHSMILGEFRQGIYFCVAELADLRVATSIVVVE